MENQGKRFKIEKIDKTITEEKKEIVKNSLIGGGSLLACVTGVVYGFKVDSLFLGVVLQLAGYAASPFAIGGIGVAIEKLCYIINLNREKKEEMYEILDNKGRGL